MIRLSLPTTNAEMARLKVGETGLPVAAVNEALCKGCGTCAASCPTGAIDLKMSRLEVC